MLVMILIVYFYRRQARIAADKNMNVMVNMAIS